MKPVKILFNEYCLADVLISLFLFTPVSAQTSVFTYQGKLNDGGVAANGNYDMRFKLFNALSSGNQVGISPAGQNNFTTLAPRQKLTSVPYSIKACVSETATKI